jgi:NlpC/P60 family putative phage cell wall peptidase
MTRTEVVAAARGWIGTPYRHQARLKGVGVDCIGLVICVARDGGLVPADFDINGYRRRPDGTTLMRLSRENMVQIRQDEMQAGDVVVVAFDTDPQHFAILADYRHGGLSMIHAASGHGHVIETRLMFSRALRFVAAFQLPGVQ